MYCCPYPMDNQATIKKHLAEFYNQGFWLGVGKRPRGADGLLQFPGSALAKYPQQQSD